MQSLKVINQQKQDQKKEEEKPLHYLYVQDGELYCTNCDFIGYYILHKECWICNATWPEGKEPKEEDTKDNTDLGPPPLVTPAPLVIQLSIPHMPDIPEYKEYNRQLDYILEERTRLSSIENKKMNMIHK
jgi:hypothetical protein